MAADLTTVVWPAALPPGARAAAQLFEILGPCAFREGERHRKTDDPARLRAMLARRVYERCHLGAAPEESDPQIDVTDEDPRWIQSILERLAEYRYREPGWRVVESRDGGCVVEREGLHVVAQMGEIARADIGGAPGIGDAVSLRVPVLRPVALPGFLVAISPHGPPDGEGLWRLYLHARVEHARDAFLGMFDALDAADLRFQAKLLRRRSLFVRPDALVVFLARRDLAAGVAMAERLADDWLADSTPGLARSIGPGRAIAPEPDGGLSYGQHAAAWVADGLISGWRAGARDAAARLAVLRECGSGLPWKSVTG